MSFYTQPNQYSLPTVTPPPAQPNKPTTCNQPVTNPLRHAKKQIREREPRDARSAASGEREPFRASFCGTRCGLRGTAWCAALGVSKRSGGAASRGAATARPRGERRGLRDARGTGRAKVAARGEWRRPARVAAGRVTHGM